MARPPAPRRRARPAPETLPALSLEEAREAAGAYARGSRAASTWRAYEADWRTFEAWCRAVQLPPLPAAPHTVALYLADEAKRGRAPSTLGRRLAAIRLMHLGARLPSPHDALEVTEVLRGIRRDFGRLPTKKKPAVDEDIRRMVDAIDTHDPQTLRGLRDRALLLLGYAAALRRSELVALDVEDLTERPEGLEVRIARSKTDQEGHGATLAVPRVPDSPYCPVRAVLDWQVVADLTTGALLRRLHRGDRRGERLTAQSVALIIKQRAAQAGLEGAAAYSGHSLRRGFLTSAARNRASIFKMAAQSRHKSLDVLREYVDDVERFEDHAGTGLLERRETEK